LPANPLVLTSDSVFAYIPGSGLTIGHPLSLNGVQQSPSGTDSTGTTTDTPVTSDYTKFSPEAEFVRDNNSFYQSDGLVGAVLKYGAITESGVNPDGSIGFNSSSLGFYNGSGTLLASATISGLAAADGSSFEGNVTGFTYDALSPGQSAVADGLFADGGLISLDPEIIADTSGFLSSGQTQAPFAVSITVVPEPSSVALSAIAAAWLLSRRRRGSGRT
jgi:hypothetical protein